MCEMGDKGQKSSSSPQDPKVQEAYKLVKKAEKLWVALSLHFLMILLSELWFSSSDLQFCNHPSGARTNSLS